MRCALLFTVASPLRVQSRKVKACQGRGQKTPPRLGDRSQPWPADTPWATSGLLREWLSSAPGSKDSGTQVKWTPQARTTFADSCGPTWLVQSGQFSPTWQWGFRDVLRKGPSTAPLGRGLITFQLLLGGHVWALGEATAGERDEASQLSPSPISWAVGDLPGRHNLKHNDNKMETLADAAASGSLSPCFCKYYEIFQIYGRLRKIS